MPKFLLTLVFLLFCSSASWAQSMDYTWEDFCEEYLSHDEEDDALNEELTEHLLNLRETPLNLNAATKEDLQGMPFLSEAQVDSILSFRQRKGGRFLSVNELMFVYNLSAKDVSYLSLFIIAAPPAKTPDKLKTYLTKGHHDIETRLDIPLYDRAGFKKYSEEELIKNPNRIYLGNKLGNILRYRYNYAGNLRWGLTASKSQGEPFGSYDNYPYDYVSAYVFFRPRGKNFSLLVGDFDVNNAQGLAVGHSFLLSPALILDGNGSHLSNFRPHSSSEENNFFRGAAYEHRMGSWRAQGFVSYRKLDALLKGDSVQSLQTTGYHRTKSEIDRKDALGCLTAGGRLEFNQRKWKAGLFAYFTHYDRPFTKKQQAYNRYYLYGKEAAVASADWTVNWGRWGIQGELATDKNFHPALTNTITADLSRVLFLLQHRHFSKAFVSPYAKTLQAGSRAANEQSILLGEKWNISGTWSLKSYVQYFYFPSETYRAPAKSDGISFMGELKHAPSQDLEVFLRYTTKAKEQNISGYAPLTEYATTHRWILQMRKSWKKAEINASLRSTMASKQTEKDEWGWMTSLRLNWKPSEKQTVSAFAALFFTDSYAAACYSYEPQLLHTFSTLAFYYHGFRSALVFRGNIGKRVKYGVKYGITHYFNKSSISSGTQLISSPTKQDLSLQLAVRL